MAKDKELLQEALSILHSELPTLESKLYITGSSTLKMADAFSQVGMHDTAKKLETQGHSTRRYTFEISKLRERLSAKLSEMIAEMSHEEYNQIKGVVDEEAED